MLPFTAISFVKKQTPDSDVVSSDSDAEDVSTVQQSCSSADYYSAVISEPPSRARAVPAQSTASKQPTRVSQKAAKELFAHVSNDDVKSVKRWFYRYFPVLHNSRSLSGEDLSMLSDYYGCNVAMTSVTHKSYETLKYLLLVAPSLADQSDNFGNSFADVVQNVKDEKIAQIVSTYTLTRERKSSKTAAPALDGDSYCAVCEVYHRDPDHISSIAHVFAENRPIMEINPHLDPANVGYQMMSKSGWSEDQGLGPSGEGRRYLIKTRLRTDRRGIGVPEKHEEKVTHFAPNDDSGVTDNLIHKRKISLKTENKKKTKREAEKTRQWEIELRRSMNELE